MSRQDGLFGSWAPEDKVLLPIWAALMLVALVVGVFLQLPVVVIGWVFGVLTLMLEAIELICRLRAKTYGAALLIASGMVATALVFFVLNH